MKRILLCFFLILFVIAVGVNFAAALSPTAAVATTFSLGGQITIFGDGAVSPMRSASMTWVKMQISWNGGTSTADAQNVINHGRNHGFKVLLSIIGSNKSALASNPTQYYQDFATFLAAVARLSPDAIEVWNEPNIDAEWPVGMINGTNYTQMLSHAYTAIKTANPNVMVISGAPAPTGYFGGTCKTNGCDDKIFIEQMAAANAANSLDCVGMHYNEGVVSPTQSTGDPRGNPTHYTRYYPTMVSTYKTVFPNKPLCFTELGYLSPEGLSSPLPAGFEWGANTSVAEQALWLSQAATLSRDGGNVRLMVVWNMDAVSTGSDPRAGWAIIRNGSCAACISLNTAMSGGSPTTTPPNTTPPPVPPPTAAPSLVSPVNGRITSITNTQFGWGTVANADSYRLEIDNSASLTSPEYVRDIVGTTYRPVPVLPDGVWTWRVRGVNAGGGGPWSVVWSVTIDTTPPSIPSLLSPTNALTTVATQPTFMWGTVTGATKYEMRLGTTNPPTTGVVSANVTSYTPASPLANGTYYWSARAIDGAGNGSTWSVPFKLTIGIVSPDSAVPSRNYYTTNPIRLTWGRITWATQYEVEVATDSAFANRVYQTTVSAPTQQVSPTLLTGAYFWRVRALGGGVTGTWSETGTFTVRVP
jgi:hypothetical protein